MSTSPTDLYLAVWGPTVVGVVLACLSQGYLTAVTVSYLTSHSRNDRWINRLVVLLLFCLTWTDTILATIELVYQSTTYRYDISFAYNYSIPILFITITCTYLTIFTCQAFMSWRCFSFAWGMRTVYGDSARRGIMGCTALLGVLNVVCLVGSVMVPVSIAKATDLYQIVLTGQDVDKQAANIYFWYLYTFSSYLAIDALITILMTTQFRSARTGFGESDSVLQAIMNLTLRNGALVTLCQIAMLIIVKAATSWVRTPITVMSRIYALTILAVLVAPRKAQQQWRIKQDAEARLDSGEMALSPVLLEAHQFGASSMSNGNVPTGHCVSCGSTSFSSSIEKGAGRRGSVLPRGGGKSTLEVQIGDPDKRLSDKDKERTVTFQAALLGLDEESEADVISIKSEKTGGKVGDDDGNEQGGAVRPGHLP